MHRTSSILDVTLRHQSASKRRPLVYCRRTRKAHPARRSIRRRHSTRRQITMLPPTSTPAHIIIEPNSPPLSHCSTPPQSFVLATSAPIPPTSPPPTPIISPHAHAPVSRPTSQPMIRTLSVPYIPRIPPCAPNLIPPAFHRTWSEPKSFKVGLPVSAPRALWDGCPEPRGVSSWRPTETFMELREWKFPLKGSKVRGGWEQVIKCHELNAQVGGSEVAPHE
ncbi:hypothetical protein T439DRAFT_1504 [Meredithblackwellia eburnea MCA 4105]